MFLHGSNGAGTNVTGQGPRGTASQPQGALSGRTVYTYGGHGWIWDEDLSTPAWRRQRGTGLNFNEDAGNQDQVDFFVPYLFNAGATVVTFRPVGYQPNEVVLDNTSAGVSFSGTWSDSVSTIHFGPGSPPYRFANVSTTETATATYAPNIPQAGFYPIYCWARYGSDRVNQLYRILHTGGEAQVRVNHRRVGHGWVYLGTYYLEAGSNPSTGSVVISNQEASGSGVIIADAIRFGNGLGDVVRGSGVSGFLRETESTRYWIQRMIGTPDNTSLYNASSGDDEQDSWGAPPRMSAHMRRDDGQGFNGDIYLGWHSNASGGSARGSVGLITGNNTTNQAEFAALVSDEIDADSLVEDANWEFTWNDRPSSTFSGGYGEISAGNNGNEMCATIIEVAFHDNTSDVALLKDPKVRNVFGRACYQAIVRYFNTYDSNPLAFLPEPPTNVEAVNSGSGSVTIRWQPGPGGAPGGDAATGYRVYRSTNGLGFGNPVSAIGTSTTISGLTPGETYYFQVAATNAGGESLPSEVVAARATSTFLAPILVVNGYDRLDRTNDQFEDLPPTAIERLRYRRNNTYDYVIQHAEAIEAAGFYFDSCANEAVISGSVDLGNYNAVVWILGEESTADDTFNSTEQTLVTNFLNGGGNIFLTGAEIGWDLDAQNNGRLFFENDLHVNYVGDDANTFGADGVGGTIFQGISLTFDDGSFVYEVDFPDRIAGNAGSVVSMTYSGGTGDGAAIQHSGGSPTRKVVMLGFPFETIIDANDRNAVMAAVLGFFGTAVPAELSALMVR
jgi:hypothetical protein